MRMRCLLLIVSFLLLSHTPMSLGQDSTEAPAGAAVQPDMDMKGSDILNANQTEVTNVESTLVTGSAGTFDTINSDSADFQSLANGTVTAGGAQSPYFPATASTTTNKDYVDGLVASLQGIANNLQQQINSISSGGGGGGGVPGTTWLKLAERIYPIGSSGPWTWYYGPQSLPPAVYTFFMSEVAALEGGCQMGSPCAIERAALIRCGFYYDMGTGRFLPAGACN